MAYYNRGGEDGIEFRQIVLVHIKRILEISSHQLKDSTKILSGNSGTNIVEQEDTRFSYVQSIENLAYVLMPWFDKEMETVYKECIEVINAFDFELVKIMDAEYKEYCEALNKENLTRAFNIEMKIRYAKKLFTELNLLLNRNDYLKKATYGEGVDDEIADGDDI